MNQLKFSVIVPVYNAEKYLERCLSSLLQQDLTSDEYEVIAVNDGSCDSSEEILRSFAGKYPNLRWITTKNRGVSEARNQGCRMAEGKYLLFVDADDSVASDSLSPIYELLERERLDVLVMDYTYWNDKNEQLRFSTSDKKRSFPTQVLEGREFMKICLPQVVWCSAYRTLFWREHHLSYLPIRHEDEEILPRIFYYAKRVLFHPIMFYYYSRNSDSFMMNYDVKACTNMVQAMKSVDKFRQECVKEVDVDLFFKNLIASRVLSAVINGIRSGFSTKELLYVVNEMKKSKLTPLPKGKGGLHKFLYNYFPSGFIAYYKLKKRRK